MNDPSMELMLGQKGFAEHESALSLQPLDCYIQHFQTDGQWSQRKGHPMKVTNGSGHSKQASHQLNFINWDRGLAKFASRWTKTYNW